MYKYVHCVKCIVMNMENDCPKIVEYKNIPYELKKEIDDYVFSFSEQGYFVLEIEVDIEWDYIAEEYKDDKFIEIFEILE